jgi:hypothetical protein
MKEYKLPKSVRFLFYLLIIFLSGWTLYFVCVAIQDHNLIIVSVLNACCALPFILIVQNWKLTVSDDALSYRLYFTETRIFLTQIAGYRVQPKFIIIESNDSQIDGLKINTTFLDNGKDEFICWLSENFKDLDEIDYKNG